MKTSNIILLTAALAISGMFLAPSLSGKYVSRQAYNQNLKESANSLEAETYGHRTVFFDQPFDRIIIRDTAKKQLVSRLQVTSGRTDPYNNIRWVKSEKAGFKAMAKDDFIQSSVIENNTLIIYTSYPNKYTGNTVIFYSPSLTHLATENTRTLQLVNTLTDSLLLTVTNSVFEIQQTSEIKKLRIRASEKSEVVTKAKHIEEARYNLSLNSRIKNEIDWCGAMYIQGDTNSYVEISPYLEQKYPARNTYDYLSFNKEIANVIINNTIIHKIDGNKANLSLHMTTRQIEQTLAVLADK